MFTKFTNLQKKSLQKIKAYRNSDLIKVHAKHFLPYDSILLKSLQKIKAYRNSDLIEDHAKYFLPDDSILFSSVALIVNDGSSSFELDYSL